MGWNQLVIKKECPVLQGINDGEFFYFVHSYFVEPDQEEDILAQTEYGSNFTSMASRGNVFGMQFHPEKSQDAGLRILDNFRKL
jgi:glutamine amidotransferase